MLDRAEYATKSTEDGRRLIRERGWAVLVVGSPGDQRAAQVPCLLDAVHDAGGAGEQLVIIGHAARADPVVPELFSGQAVLLVFQGPNGYISPAWYGESPSPPTWNFTAVHWHTHGGWHTSCLPFGSAQRRSRPRRNLRQDKPHRIQDRVIARSKRAARTGSAGQAGFRRRLTDRCVAPLPDHATAARPCA
jgi:hypothetical protein